MTDHSQQIDQIHAAADICQQHVITMPVNGIQPEYPRWPEAWKACEVVWRVYLDMKTIEGSADDDRKTVILEARRLKGF